MPKDSFLMNQSSNIDAVTVGGITPLTTIDYPGELSAVIFLQGCSWRCGYCQNHDLIPRENCSNMPWSNVITLLEKRKGLLDAVVFSGGEPTLQSGLLPAIKQVQSMGFKIGLHTAGIYPDRLRKVLPFIDWVGFDIKSAIADYEKITGVKNSGKRAWQSARLLLGSGVNHEFRTTVHPDILNNQQLQNLSKELVEIGARHYVIQECVTKNCLNKKWRSVESSKPEAEFIYRLGEQFSSFDFRSL